MIEKIKKLPGLCGVDQGEEWGEIMEFCLEKEKDSTSALARKAGKTPGDRLEQAFAWVALAKDKARAFHCYKLGLYAICLHDNIFHGATYDTVALKKALEASEAEYTDLAETVSVAEVETAVEVQALWA